MSSVKIIENPEVPGFERFLLPPPPSRSPPPPPPPPPLSSTSEPSDGNTPSTTTQQQRSATESVITAVTTEMAIANEGVLPSFATFPPNVSPVPPNPYMLHPTMQPQSSGQPATSTPWWIPDSDTSDIYTQWYDPTYKGAVIATAASSTVTPAIGKSKNKNFYKRKNEFIDPAQDAEKVASAQRELSALMKPLKCDLCNAVMNSTLQAKLHYDGKPHQKKVSMYLNQSVKKQKTDDGQVSSTTKNDWQNYCDICKTWFTSQTDATQHYAGKKHIRAANGGPRTRPSKKLQNQNQYNQVDSTGRFGIGMSFQTDAQSAPAVTPTVAPDGTTTANSNPAAKPAKYRGPPAYFFRCDLCGVSANRHDQLETHKRGARHLRMLRLNGLHVPEPVAETENASSTSEPIDYSIYRTPSGQYYCAPCNLSLNSETKFALHVESKKHKNQSNLKLSNTTVTAKKARFKKK